MLKKKTGRLNKRRASLNRLSQARFLILATLGLATVLSLGVFVGPQKNSLAFGRLHGFVLPTVPSASNPSKEYIYAGGKLIATEEPQPVSLAAPLSLNADTASSSRIDITWLASSGADHYEIERRPNINSAWTTLSSNITVTSFPDTTVFGVNAYLYRVRAVDATGNVSPYSNVDVSTAITFTDESLIADSTVIKSQHIMELRQAVNAVRATVNLPPLNWTDNLPSLSGINVRAIHIEELRSALDEALNALGLPLNPYSDSGPAGLVGLPIRKTHIDELRQRVK